MMKAEPSPAPIRVLVVDDEPLARSNLLHALRHRDDVQVLGDCETSAAALESIRRDRPDLVFLDVRMPEHDGFDILEMLGSEAPPAVIFVTAYDQYALKAFEAGALDYLLKPFSNARFARALDRARERIAQRQLPPVHLDRFTIKSAGKVLFLAASEVDWIEAADYYASLHVGVKTHLLRRSMNDLESDLDPARFCRIHRSTIVNLDRVREICFDSEAEYEVVLADQTRLRLSRRYKKDLESRLKPPIRVNVEC